MFSSRRHPTTAGNPFQSLDKTAVLQETRAFNETPVNARRCTHILTKILYLINQGEKLGENETTDTFFAMTKLFQSKDVVMRRMLYLGIKELTTLREHVIIVTSSLSKDMNGKEDLYRAAAIRALCSITDHTSLQDVERYMKQWIVDKNAAVSSAALVSSLHLSHTAGDWVKRWANEAQEALNSGNIMVQYHALGLLYRIRKSDRLAVSKLVNKLTRQSLKSPYAICQLIRIASRLIEDDEAANGAESREQRPLFEWLSTCLRHKSEMVVYEAAHAVVNLRGTSARELAPAVSILQLFCGSPKATLRFAAVRTLNKVAMIHPAAVTTCNLDLEALITDPNRSVATLAITTLLKTGAESSVERLMKQIATFVADITDEFKIVIVQAIRALCSKFPRKHAVLVNFLSQMLREEGGLAYKTAIVDTMITIIEENADAKESGLAHLCEFIEDCEHTTLAVRILHLLGKEGPFSATPSKYIRFIYNRVILENATVRAAAVAAMAQFGAACPTLLPNILVLLARCQMDEDDEVRDRATYYAVVLRAGRPELQRDFIVERPLVSVPLLERALREHCAGDCAERFDFGTVPTVLATSNGGVGGLDGGPAGGHDGSGFDGMLLSSGGPTAGSTIGGAAAAAKVPKLTREERNAERLAQLPGIQRLGALHRSSAPVQLTETETEYTVSVIKHCYARHVVFQFDCVNTLSDQLLENVRVDLQLPDGSAYAIRGVVPCARLPYGEQQLATFVIVEFPPEDDLHATVAIFGSTLRFLVKDCDPSTGLPDSEDGYEDEYMLEDLEVTVADQMQRVKKQNFAQAWEAASDESECLAVFLVLQWLNEMVINPTRISRPSMLSPPAWVEAEDTFALSAVTSLQEAVDTILKVLGLAANNSSEKVASGTHTHTLVCSGKSPLLRAPSHLAQAASLA